MSPSPPRRPGPLDSAALGLLLAGLLLRLFVSGGGAPVESNLLLHSLPFAAAALFCLARFLDGRWTIRWSGAEIPLLVWGALATGSILSAAWKLPAIDAAAAFAAMALLPVLLIQVAGPERRLMLVDTLLAATAGIVAYALLQPALLLPLLRESTPMPAGPGADEFARRLASNEPWGTFLQPNSLAGFLVLAIPLCAGSLVDGRGSPLRFRIARAATLVAAVVTLVMTGSKGGWASMAAAAGAGAILLLARRFPARRGPILAGGLALGLALGAAGWIVTTRNDLSMQFRAEYSSAALKATATSPALGIGLGNYEDAYPRFKGELQEETRKVHNDYLQVLCELGALGLLTLLVIFGHAARAASAVETVPAEEAPPSWLPLGSGVAAAFGAAILTSDPLLGLAVAPPFVLSLLATRASAPADATFTRIGLAAGLAGLAVHLSVDYDLYEYGVGAALFAAAGLALLFGRKTDAILAGRGAAVTWAAAAVAVALAMNSFAGRLQEAERLGRKAEAATTAVERSALLQAAAEAASIDDARHAELARFRLEAWRALRDHGAGREELQAAENLAFAAWEAAIHLRPFHSPHRHARGLAHEEVGRRYLELSSQTGPTSGILQALGQEHMTQALGDLDTATRLYPTRAINRAARARLLDAHGRRAEAAAEAREALRLSGLATATPRLQLDAAQRADMERISR